MSKRVENLFCSDYNITRQSVPQGEQTSSQLQRPIRSCGLEQVIGVYHGNHKKHIKCTVYVKAYGRYNYQTV